MYPLRDRTNRSVTGVSTSSAMLPGINSTPPLPTFQRATPAQLLRRPPQPPQQPLPRLEPAPMNTSRRRVLSEADLLPSPSFSVMPTATALPTTPTPPVLPTRAPARASPRATPTVPATAPTPTVSTARVRPTHRVHQFTAVGSNTGEDKTSHTPSLPRNWSAKHDHLICLYDGNSPFFAPKNLSHRANLDSFLSFRKRLLIDLHHPRPPQIRSKLKGHPLPGANRKAPQTARPDPRSRLLENRLRGVADSWGSDVVEQRHCGTVGHGQS